MRLSEDDGLSRQSTSNRFSSRVEDEAAIRGQRPSTSLLPFSYLPSRCWGFVVGFMNLWRKNRGQPAKSRCESLAASEAKEGV